MSKRRWPGGYVHRQANGADLYIIEKRIRGERFHVSTCATSITAAMKQLERFQAAPADYDPGMSVDGEDALPFDGRFVLEYYDYMVAPKTLRGKGNYQRHSKQMRSHMLQWAKDLRGKDLRKLDLGRDIVPVVEIRSNPKGRITALKGFFTWLRVVKHLVKTAQDPMLDMPIPVGDPEQNSRIKVVPFEHVEAVVLATKEVLGKQVPILSDRTLDMLNLLMATGWHISEAERFIREPEGEIILNPPGPTVLAALVMRHKNGEKTSTPIALQNQLESAQRLKESGTFPNQSRMNKQLREACAAARIDDKPVPKFTFGVMRHTVGTWAVEQGATVKEVAVFLHHKSDSTTRRFYIRTNMPVPGVPVRSLQLVR